MSAKLPNPGIDLHRRDALRERLLRCLRAAPTPGGALRRRFGKSIQTVLADAHQCGLVVRDEAGEWWLTHSGREALKGTHEPTAASAG